jgi:hypothetical protein
MGGSFFYPRAAGKVFGDARPKPWRRRIARIQHFTLPLAAFVLFNKKYIEIFRCIYLYLHW